jgi:hypothetical protein
MRAFWPIGEAAQADYEGCGRSLSPAVGRSSSPQHASSAVGWLG